MNSVIGLTAYVSGRLFYSRLVGDIGNIREQRHMRLAGAYLDCTGLPDAEADVASVAAWIGLIEAIARMPAESVLAHSAVVFELRPAYTLTVTKLADRGALVTVDEDQCAVIRASSAHLDDVLVSVATLLHELGSIGTNSISELRTAFSVRTYDPSHDIVSLLVIPHGRCGMCGEDVPRFYAMAPGIVCAVCAENPEKTEKTEKPDIYYTPCDRNLRLVVTLMLAIERARGSAAAAQLQRSCSAVDGAEAGPLGRQAHADGREVSDEEVRVRSAGPSDSVKK